MTHKSLSSCMVYEMKSPQIGPTVILYAKFIFSGILVCGVRKETLHAHTSMCSWAKLNNFSGSGDVSEV